MALTRLPLHFQPGTRWKYSLSIDVIGHIVEIISGQSLDRFFEEQIFKPLGMIDTAFYVPSEKVSRLAKVYGHVGDNPQLEHIPVVFTEALPHPPSHLIAGGGLFSTLPDYARFAQKSSEERTLGTKSMRIHLCVEQSLPSTLGLLAIAVCSQE